MIQRVVTGYLSSPAWRYAAAALLLLATGLCLFAGTWLIPMVPYRYDLEVYLLGGEVLRTGGELYDRLPDLHEGANSPFTYPPLAAALFVPMSILSLPVTTMIHSVATIAALGLVCYLVIARTVGERAAGERAAGAGRRDLLWLTVAALALGLATGPVRETITYGQINVLLMALILVDCLAGRGRWWGGTLVGFAMAIKLTPATMVLFFLLRRDWRSAAMAVVSAVGFTGIGFLVAPSDSVRYWTEVLWDPGRIGWLAFASNQSINGALARLGVPEAAQTPLWFGLCVVAGLAIAAAGWRLIQRGEDAGAAVLIGFVALLCSPVSWGHHWVWCVPMLIVIAGWAGRGGGGGAGAARAGERAWGVLLATGLLVFVVAPQWWFSISEEDHEQSWGVIATVVGNSYLLWTIIVLVALLVTTPGEGRRRTDDDRSNARRKRPVDSR